MNDNFLEVYRTENKYLLSQVDYSNLSNKLNKILEKDKNSKCKKYNVRSLYFDTINDNDFYQKLSGDYLRKKVRLRIYDTNQKECKLEIKYKYGNNQRKISLIISSKDAIKIIEGHYNVLTKYFDKENAISIYNILILNTYKPVIMIEYDRIAYTYPLYNTRITFDSNIRYSQTNFNLFEKNINYNVGYNEKIILEVKYNEILCDFISNILSSYNINKLSISKYCIGRTGIDF